MRVLLSAINAKFIHPALSLYSIAAYNSVYGKEKDILIKEFTINHRHEFIISEIFGLAPEILCFSCYIWNIEPTKRVCRAIKKILPETKIILGGPEVSFEYDSLLEDKICEIIVIGEGEATFTEILDYYSSGEGSLYNIAGIAFFDNGVVTGKQRTLLNLDTLPFPYTNILESFENRIIYYEASRGCPFACSYCMSSIEKGVRYLSLERVFSELKYFLENETLLVKFTDRTFNCDKERAVAIWNFLKENDNGKTVFHFEIAADLLTDELCGVLSTARKGLFQLEIGVQTTNVGALEIINRKTDLAKLFSSVRKLKSFSNISLHLDLIAGLPEEDFNSFKNSFNKVYGLNPDTLQLGFLKLLKGLPLRSGYGIAYDDSPPYTVLSTEALSFAELQVLRDIEVILDIYYNKGKAYYTVTFSIQMFKSPFDFYYKFSKYWRENGLYERSHSKAEIFNILYKFVCGAIPGQSDFIKDLLVFDMCKKDNIKTFPEFASDIGDRDVIRTLYIKHVPKRYQKMYHIRCFNYDIVSWIESGFREVERKITYILFDYTTSEHIPKTIQSFP